MTKPYNIKNERKPEQAINEIFIKRWSPRAISNKNFTENDLMLLFEAVRWAPSSSNIQPWRFLYSMKGDGNWNTFFSLLGEFNQMWTKDAGALIVILSKKTDDEGKPNALHSFDTGSAWMSLALQARMKNLIAHGMTGFDYEKARKLLNVPNDYNVEAMIAIGTQGEVENLHERMQRSEKPNERKHVKEFVSKGKFPTEK